MRAFALSCLALAGCGDDTTSANDLARAADLRQVDQAQPPRDLAGADLAAADLATADLATAGDLAVQDQSIPADLTALPDLTNPADLAGDDLASPNSKVSCGAMSCGPPSSICCRSQPYGDGTCIAPGDPCAFQQFPCDDDSDCAQGDVCCYLAGMGSTCTSGASCTAMMGQVMCHVANDCPVVEMCCGVGASPNYHCAAICPISRRDAKQDIDYLDEAGRRGLSDELLRYRLATYRYRADGDAGPRHLGFIIDDVEPSMSIAPNGDSVDLYGYTSMAVAAVQEQAQRMEALEREVKELRRELARRRR